MKCMSCVIFMMISFIGLGMPILEWSNRLRTTMTTSTTRSPKSKNKTHVESCFISPGELGECVDVRSCPPIVNELKIKLVEPGFARYVKASNFICGKVGKKVCCPIVRRRLPTEEEGCGQPNILSFRKIIDGNVAEKGAWPWIALLGYNDGTSSPFKCGGTLITDRHIVTAAHCIRDELAFVRLGEHDLSTDAETHHIDIKVIKSECHPEYNPRNSRSDIAIIHLEHNIEFTDLIMPICMPNSPSLRVKSYVGESSFVIGWGKTQEGGKTAAVLNQLKIPIVDNEVCRNCYDKLDRYFTVDQFDKAVLCAGYLRGGYDTCQGDSGGPLMSAEDFRGSKRFYLIGVVSYGFGCGRSNAPGVYSSTQYCMDWIIKKLEERP